MVVGVDSHNELDRGGGERASDGPEEAGPLAAEDGGLVEDDNFALFVRGGRRRLFSYQFGLVA